MSSVTIGFWNKAEGKILTMSRKGLTKEQVEFLKSLKEGDELVITKAKKFTEYSPDYLLKLNRLIETKYQPE